MVDMMEIASKLTQRTSERRIAWKPTADPNSFVAVVGKLNIMVWSEQASRWDPPKARLEVLDGKGMRIASVKHDTYGPGDEQNLEIVALYEAARTAALNVDEQLTELLDTLDSGDDLTGEISAHNLPRPRPAE